MKNRPVIVLLHDSSLCQRLMDHLVEERIFHGVGSAVQVSADVNGRWIAKVSPIPSATSNADRYLVEEPGKVYTIKLIPPNLERS